jgi:aldose 1-epimerase
MDQDSRIANQNIHEMVLSAHYSFRTLIIIFTIITMTNCQGTQNQGAGELRFPRAEDFNKEVLGKQVKLHTLTNQQGMRVDITNYGGRIVTLFVPDKDGKFDDVVTGYLTIDEYLNSNELYFGAIIGRYGNRIAGGRFSIDGNEYQLATNNGPNNLHGGPGGFHNVVWDSEQQGNNLLTLRYLSPDNEEGFPGNLQVTVRYILTENNELHMEYQAMTDKKTVVNLTNHAFFNLGGEGEKTINDHLLKINATHFTPVSEELIPTGVLEPVKGTPFDFTEYTAIGARIDADSEQLKFARGYDHNFVLDIAAGTTATAFAASAYDPVSMRRLDVFTTEPGIQFYGGNFLTGNDTGKRGEPYLFRTSFCLETQHYPDSPNQPNFPSTLLEPGQVYQTKTIYKFSVMGNE